MGKAVDEIEALEMFGSRLGLERISELLGLLGNPEKKFKSIQVAGTNGKGSVTCLLARLLESAGFKAGSYYSPHVTDYYERIQLNGKKITPQELEPLWEKVKAASRKMKGKPTYFEVTTALACLYFAAKKADWAVLEVGLGGRLDATSACPNEAGVVANVCLEHTDRLGKTIAQIAREKASIAQKGKFLVTAETKGDALSEIEKVCAEKGAKLVLLNDVMQFDALETREAGGKVTGAKAQQKGEEEKPSWHFQGKGEYETSLGLPGYQQGVNAALALATLEALKIPLERKRAEKALAEAFLPGRLEMVQEKPLIILDGAHNPAAAEVLFNNLDNFNYDRLFLVFSVMKDKEIPGVLGPLAGEAFAVIVTRVKDKPERCALPQQIALEAQKSCSRVYLKDNVKQALALAENLAKPEDMILVTGSFYLVAEARPLFKGLRDV